MVVYSTTPIAIAPSTIYPLHYVTMSQYPTLQPYIPDNVFPIMLTVFHGDSPSPDCPANSLRSGELYLSPSNIWIVQCGEWTRWNPPVSLLHDINGDKLYTSPCAIQGLKLVMDEAMYTGQLPGTRQQLSLSNDEDMTAAIGERIWTVVGIKMGDVDHDITQVYIPVSIPV